MASAPHRTAASSGLQLPERKHVYPDAGDRLTVPAAAGVVRKPVRNQFGERVIRRAVALPLDEALPTYMRFGGSG